MSVSLSELLREDVWHWSDARLRIWCRDIPLLLLCALTVGGEPSQAGLPRERGPYTMSEMGSVLHYSLLAELESDPAAWRALGRWALRRLYPEYRRRTGKEHACEARVYWCGRTHTETAERVLGYREVA